MHMVAAKKFATHEDLFDLAPPSPDYISVSPDWGREVIRERKMEWPPA